MHTPLVTHPFPFPRPVPLPGCLISRPWPHTYPPCRNAKSRDRFRFTQVPALALLGVALRLLAHARPPLRPGLWFPALLPLSTALYLAALAVCVPVSALSLLRLCLFPRATRRATLGDGNASGFDLGHLASWPAGCALLVAFAAFAVAEGRVRGRAADPLVLAAYACWWLAAAWVAGWAVLVLAMLLSKQSRASSRTPRGRFAPLLGLLDCTTAVATVALAGGLLAWLVLSPGLAAPVVVFSLCAAGSALFLAAFDYAVILHELLLVTGWPPPEITAAVFAMVGPLAQTAAALLVLADAELGDAADSGARTETDLAVMPPMQLVCVLLALLMGGMAVAWLFFGFVICFYHLSRGKLVWSPGWNAAVSPVATLAVLSILLGKHLGGPFFGIAGCVIVVFCLVMFLVNMVFTVQWAVTARRQRDVRAKEDTVAA